MDCYLPLTTFVNQREIPTHSLANRLPFTLFTEIPNPELFSVGMPRSLCLYAFAYAVNSACNVLPFCQIIYFFQGSQNGFSFFFT